MKQQETCTSEYFTHSSSNILFKVIFTSYQCQLNSVSSNVQFSQQTTQLRFSNIIQFNPQNILHTHSIEIIYVHTVHLVILQRSIDSLLRINHTQHQYSPGHTSNPQRNTQLRKMFTTGFRAPNDMLICKLGNMHFLFSVQFKTKYNRCEQHTQ